MKHVTFTGSDDGVVAVDLDGKEFPLGVEVSNVSENDVERLQAIVGHSFEVTDAKASSSNKKGA